MTDITVESDDLCIDVDEKTLMEVFDLSPREAQFLRPMLYYTIAEKDTFPTLSYNPRQIIYTLRKKINSYGVRIKSYGEGRYGFVGQDKQKLKPLLCGSN